MNGERRAAYRSPAYCRQREGIPLRDCRFDGHTITIRCIRDRGGGESEKKRQRLYEQNRTMPPERSVALCGVSLVKCQNILKGKAVPTRALDIWMPDAPTCRPFVSICRMEHRRFIPGLPDDLQSQRNTIPIKTAWDTYGGKTIIVGKDGILR